MGWLPERLVRCDDIDGHNDQSIMATIHNPGSDSSVGCFCNTVLLLLLPACLPSMGALTLALDERACGRRRPARASASAATKPLELNLQQQQQQRLNPWN